MRLKHLDDISMMNLPQVGAGHVSRVADDGASCLEVSACGRDARAYVRSVSVHYDAALEETCKTLFMLCVCFADACSRQPDTACSSAT
jgi:hypothetical protein